MSDILLAIVIPAYKPDFLRAALQSIANQEVKNFRVYVGDDASPANLAAICSSYETVLDLHYVRFDSNLGQSDLTAHWNRCVRMSSEPWVWLFSDDDLMEPSCTSRFERAVSDNCYGVDLFHFNVTKIDGEGRVLTQFPAYPELLSGRAFALERLQSRLESFAPDYIFSRDVFERVGGFVSFPLAWCSDDATWVAFAGNKGICTLDGPRVKWRLSGQNITSRSPALGRQKLQAATSYLSWLQQYLLANPSLPGDLSNKQVLHHALSWWFKQISYTQAPFGISEVFWLSWRLRRVPPGYLGWLLRAIRRIVKYPSIGKRT